MPTTEPDQTCQTRKRTCHVVLLGYGHEGDQVEAVCPTLPADVLDQLRRSVRPWFRSRTLKAVRAIVAREDLPGLVLVWNQTPFPKPTGLPKGEYYPDCPPPFDLPFEPVELDETDPRFSHFADEKAPDKSDPAQPVIPRMPRRRSYVSTLGLMSMAMLVGLLLVPVADILACCLPFVLMPFVVACARLPFAGHRWFLVPGGVVVRHTRFGGSSVRLQVHTPADTVLSFVPNPPGWWAELHGSRCTRRFVTQAEFRALLRVWQSPLRPPTHLDDLGSAP